jgi:hypothetical protein
MAPRAKRGRGKFNTPLVFREQTGRSYFDAGRVMKWLSVRERIAFVRIGRYIQTVAKDSMQQRPRFDYSEPGEPPHAHTGLIKNFIRFAYDDEAGTLVVGPLPLKASSIRAGEVSPATVWISDQGPHPGTTGASIQEFGGRAIWRDRPVKIEARPAMRPALDKAIKARVLTDAWANLA